MSRPDLDAIAIQTVAAHIRRLTALVDDIPSVQAIVTCAETLEDRATLLATTRRDRPRISGEE